MRKVELKTEHEANWQLVPLDDGVKRGKHFATPVPKREPRKKPGMGPVEVAYIIAIAAMFAVLVAGVYLICVK